MSLILRVPAVIDVAIADYLSPKDVGSYSTTCPKNYCSLQSLSVLRGVVREIIEIKKQIEKTNQEGKRQRASLEAHQRTRQGRVVSMLENKGGCLGRVHLALRLLCAPYDRQASFQSRIRRDFPMTMHIGCGPGASLERLYIKKANLETEQLFGELFGGTKQLEKFPELEDRLRPHSIDPTLFQSTYRLYSLVSLVKNPITRGMTQAYDPFVVIKLQKAEKSCSVILFQADMPFNPDLKRWNIYSVDGFLRGGSFLIDNGQLRNRVMYLALKELILKGTTTLDGEVMTLERAAAQVK